MMKVKQYFPIFIFVLAMVFCISLPMAAEVTETNAEAASEWTIKEYDEKTYTAVTEAMNGYDPKAPEAPGLTATAAVLMDAKTGQILYEIDPDGLRYPASLTKLLTLVVTLDAIDKGKVGFDDEVVFSETAVTQESSYLKLEPGATDNLRHCLEMMIVFSANDAAWAIAEHVGGTVENFAAMMNETAKVIGMNASNFVNPNGLPDPNHWSTARDIAILSRYCTTRDDVMSFVSMEKVTILDDKEIYNTNKLLFLTEGVDGLKTGRTLAAGHCLAATAERDGMRLVSVTLGSPEDYSHYVDGMKLLEYGFANYSQVKAVSKGDLFGEIDVVYGREDTVEVASAEDIYYTVKNGESQNPEVTTEFAASVEGPAEAGIYAGEVVVTLNGAEIGRCDLVTAEEIKKRTVWQWLGDFFKALIQSI